MRPAGGAGLAALCRRWMEAAAASGLVDARWVQRTFPAPAGVGGLAVRCAGFPRADLTPTQSWVWAEKDGHPKSPIPTTLF